VIYDPLRQVLPEVVTVYGLRHGVYERQAGARFPLLKLGLVLWDGTFEGKHDTWLRWTDEDGGLISTSRERAEQEHQRAEQAHQQAEQEHQRAEQAHQQAEQERQRAEQARQQAEQERQRAEQGERLLVQERQRAERLAALLRRSGIDPDQA